MGLNTLSTQSDGTVIDASDINQYKTALVNDFVPRNSAGAPTSEDGSLGSSTYAWLKAHIESGYWSVGDIKPHHSYNGAAPIGQGWFPCLGDVINETNYNAIHGAGSWDTYVASSDLNGKYAPDLTNGYLTGTSSTSQDGSSSITTVGNSSNAVNISHTHTTSNHNHAWYFRDRDSGASPTDLNGTSYNSTGTNINLDTDPANGSEDINHSLLVGDVTGGGGSLPTGVRPLGEDDNDTTYYTSNAAPSTNTGGGTSQDIRPRSTEVVYYIRII